MGLEGGRRAMWRLLREGSILGVEEGCRRRDLVCREGDALILGECLGRGRLRGRTIGVGREALGSRV